MPPKYYLHDGNETTGPFTVDELVVFQSADRFTREAKIHDGTNWMGAADFLRDHGTAAKPEQVLQAALVLEKAENGEVPVMTKARWESLLFIVSFPVLIPSLILSFVMAKRWGHIDIYLILVDGLILTAIGFATGFLTGTLVIISWISSVFLYWLRRDSQEGGIFLGYSNLVAMLLIVGGTLTIGGFIAVFPFSQFNAWRDAGQRPLEITVAAAVNRALPHRGIVLTDGVLDMDQAMYRRKEKGKWRFVSKQQLEDVRFQSGRVRTLWNNHQEMAGREVDLVDVAPSGFGVRPNRVEVVEGAVKRMLDTSGKNFTLVEGSDARVWIVSGAPVAAGRVSVRGVARTFNNDAETARAYAQAKRGNLPLMGIAVFDGERGPPLPAPEAQEVWVPVKNSKGEFVIRFPDGVTPTGKERAGGFHSGPASAMEGLDEVSARLFSRSDSRIFYQQTPAAYLAEQKVFEKMRANTAWKHTPWLAGGLALLGLAIWRARNE